MGRYVSLYSFRDVFTVSQTTLVKLNVITNCKFVFFLVIFGLWQVRQPAWPMLLYMYFGSREKYFF